MTELKYPPNYVSKIIKEKGEEYSVVLACMEVQKELEDEAKKKSKVK